MTEQTEIPTFEERLQKLAHNRARILKLINARPGLTYEELGKQFLLTYGYLPTIDNRIRELRTLGLVVTTTEDDGRLHVYPKKEESP